MRYQKRENMYEVNIWRLKHFVLEVASFYQYNDLYKSVLLTCCLDELRSLIKNNPMFHQMILKYLMNSVDIEMEAASIEHHLVTMKLLLNWKDHNYRAYRQKLLKKLQAMANPYYTSDLHVLIRHLVDHKPRINPEQLLDDDLQKYFLCEIYLIEEDYKMAYTYLKDCRYVGVLQEYDEELRNYSYFKYKKYILKESIFNFGYLGERVWMRSQLKY